MKKNGSKVLTKTEAPVKLLMKEMAGENAMKNQSFFRRYWWTVLLASLGLGAWALIPLMQRSAFDLADETGTASIEKSGSEAHGVPDNLLVEPSMVEAPGSAVGIEDPGRGGLEEDRLASGSMDSSGQQSSAQVQDAAKSGAAPSVSSSGERPQLSSALNLGGAASGGSGGGSSYGGSSGEAMPLPVQKFTPGAQEPLDAKRSDMNLNMNAKGGGAMTALNRAAQTGMAGVRSLAKEGARMFAGSTFENPNANVGSLQGGDKKGGKSGLPLVGENEKKAQDLKKTDPRLNVKDIKPPDPKKAKHDEKKDSLMQELWKNVLMIWTGDVARGVAGLVGGVAKKE